MTLTMVRLTGGPLDGSTLGLEEPLAERVAGEELQDMVEALPAVRAALAGCVYDLEEDPLSPTIRGRWTYVCRGEFE